MHVGRINVTRRPRTAELASESTFSVALAIWSDKEKIMLLLQSTLIELSSWRGQPLFWQRRRTSK
jgi:hypothetical protein